MLPVATCQRREIILVPVLYNDEACINFRFNTGAESKF